MPIRRRLREDFWLVSRDDDALDDMSPAAAASYGRTYEWRLIERYLAEYPDKKPTWNWVSWKTSPGLQI